MTFGKRILIAGGAGFIGSHLARALVSMDYEVAIVDNFFTGDKANLKFLNIHDSVEVIRHDINFPLYLETDFILNLACPASPRDYQQDPVQTMKTSVQGSINLLGLAKRTGARILLASTSEVYGDPQISPQPESYLGNVNQLGPRACYDEGKRAAETLFNDYNRQHGVDIRIARIFNTYGPLMRPDDGRVVSNFIVAALENEPLTIHGDGLQTRSFCYVDDLVKGLIALLFKEAFHAPVNLGNPEEVTVSQLAQKVIEMTASSSSTQTVKLPQDDPKRRRPSIERANQVLNWQPETTLSVGLEKTIKYFQDLKVS